LAKVLKRVAELDFDDFEGSQIDLFGDAYEFLISNYAANAGKSGGEFFTPQQVSKLIAMLAMHKQAKINKILDPACGSGSLLLRAKRQFDEHIIEEGFFGQEVNHTTYNLARMNMFLHNINYDKFDIRLGDTLTDPQFGDEKPFDANGSYTAKTWSKPESGGFVWHTTGSGKTLTSFKAARLATELDFIDKVFFVVDRKDLDYQTMKEYQRFSPDSVNGSNSTAGLKSNLEKDDNKIIVTTIQKLNNLMKGEGDLPIYSKHVVFIFDECHRSQFGEAQKNIRKKFKRYYQFGFTGTPIFPQNALGAETTASVFGRELHSYVITDAIRDEKVLKFKVDYNDVRPKFKAIEMEQDEKKLTSAENRQALLHPERIREISQYILTHYRQKTHRLRASSKRNTT
jgi:type I restriction enzyme R subunit